jgi:imidazolonepropionase-like amidohydrolase
VKYLLVLSLLFAIAIVPITSTVNAEQTIPSWIKTTADFWVKGQVSDKEFINALQYLVKEKILTIPQTETILSGKTISHDPIKEGKILFTNVNIFDGKSDSLQPNMNVLVVGNKIQTISQNKIEPQSDTMTIDGKGRTMTPGFIDLHAHMMLQMSVDEAFTTDEFYHAYVATQTADTYLMHGFTTIRDMSGNSFSLKKSIDKGIIDGPRIYPSGPMISQTSGHSDHRFDAQDSALVGGEPSVMMKYGHVAIADGEAEVLKAVRENLRRGATQIKIAVGGGVGSYADPLDVTEYTPTEIRAAVQAANDWGTYVAAHVYNSDGIRRAVDNGVISIEHGNLVDESTLLYMKEHDVWLSPQVVVFQSDLKGFTADQIKKQEQANAGIDNMFTMAKKIGYDKIVFGSDFLSDPEQLKNHLNDEFTARAKWFTPAEVMQQATSKAGELVAMSGPRNPYGKVGVIEEGAMADLLLINGNPLEDINILANPDDNFVIIMKDGKIYKDIFD